MQLSHLWSPVTARVLLHRSSRRLLPDPQEAPPPERRPSLIPTIPEATPPDAPSPERRPSLIPTIPEATPPDATPSDAPPSERRPSLVPTIPEAVAPERRRQFRRRNAMSLSDAYSVCLICHNELSRGSEGTRELQCSHTFHRECIEEWLWRKPSCPSCHALVSVTQPAHWSSTRVKGP
ncbi:RING finger protein 44 [Clinocottus analis]|uniref:RING finger protein 44 n=1 Tax=Clinocottus analis TaxID=304258 RepID=UPI0035BF4423